MTTQVRSLYDKIRKQFIKPKIQSSEGERPRVAIDSKKVSADFLDDLLQSCVELYNQIDSVVEAFKLTVPEAYEEFKQVVDLKIIGGLSEKFKPVIFEAPSVSYMSGEVKKPKPEELPCGIRSIIDLLRKAIECLEMGWRVNAEQFYYTARLSFRALRSSLTQFLTRFDYVMMYPHRIVYGGDIFGVRIHK